MSIAAVADTRASLIDDLARALGREGVLQNAEARAFYSTDVYRAGARPLAVLRPDTVERLQEAVRLAAGAGVAIVPRGGGASYTDGYAPPREESVVIDLGRLDRIVEIDERNAVATVEAGCTWAALRAPFSGIAATVGGSMSQNAISHGSGAYGISAQSALAMDVVSASGELIRVGPRGPGGAAFVRHYGPDLTGLFTGDCGALGLKARVALPLLKKRPAFQCASFAFARFEDLHETMRAVALEGLDDENFAVDATLMQGQIARSESAGARMQMAWTILRTAPNPLAGLALLAKLGLGGAEALKSLAFAAHFILEGVDQAEARARLHRLRELAGGRGGELPAAVPSFVRAMPFAPLNNVLGPKGERWVPLHGILPHDQAAPFHQALQAFYADEAEAMSRHGLIAGGMFESVGSTGFLYEIALYWPDERTVYHETVLEADVLKALPTYDAAPEARAYVHDFKSRLIDLYRDHGAAHYQIGRSYPYTEAMDAATLDLVRAVKAAVDPQGLMNPGALGL